MCHKIIEIFTKSQGVLKVNKLGQIGSADKKKFETPSERKHLRRDRNRMRGIGSVHMLTAGGGYLISAFD